MRYISKRAGQLECITTFIDTQLKSRAIGEEGFVDYRSFHTGELKKLLFDEQGGICAYTGVGLEESQLAARQPSDPTPPNRTHWFTPHIEHLKPQSVCRDELRQQGNTPGVDLGEDIDYHNMVAAVLVGGSIAEQFGASVRGDVALPIWPTMPNCEAAFTYAFDGTVSGSNRDAERVIQVLKLDHPTLVSWRSGAINAWLPYVYSLVDDEIVEIAERLNNFQNGQLLEFCFVVRSFLLSLVSTGFSSTKTNSAG